MSVIIGSSRGGVVRNAVQLALVAALVTIVLNSQDIQRYLRIRSM